MQKRILLIDDEASIRRTLSIELKQNGYDVEPCENGIDALKKLDQYKKNEIDLDGIVIDIKLPDIDGLTLAKIIISKFPGISIFLITGYKELCNDEDMEIINPNALLEKPFLTEDLVYQIEKAKPDQAPKKKIDLLTEVKESKTISSYMLIKLDENANYLDIYRKLYFQENTLYCDITNGDYDIVLLSQAGSVEECKKVCDTVVRKIDGIKSVEFLEISLPVIDEKLKEILVTAENALSNKNEKIAKERNMSKGICSYIFLEIEREKFDHIYPVLFLDENVIYCDYTTGKYNLILFVHGIHFKQIDDFIEEKILNLDGILKVKEFPVVNLIDM